MIKFVPFKAEDMDQLADNLTEETLKGYLSSDNYKALEQLPYAYTAVNAHGKVFACCGIYEYWTNRAEAWAYISKDCADEFYSLTYHIRKFLNACPVRRIEAVVSSDMDRGRRWVSLLGFKLECETLTKYFPGGQDASLFALVKEFN